MLKFKKIMYLITAGTLLTIGGWSAISSTSKLPVTHADKIISPSEHYQIQAANYHRLRVVNHDATLWQEPSNEHVKAVGNMTHFTHTNELVHLNQQARLNGKIQYYQIGRQGRTFGWVSANDLHHTQEYILPYRYISQFWPSHANDACEAAALMMALSAKGKGMHTPLRQVVKRIPRSTNPYYGYTKDPFKLGTAATIYPRALAKVSRRQFNIRAKDITGASKKDLIYDIEHGNPVVFSGSYKMRDTKSDHSLVLLGYKRGYFYFADPFSKVHGQVINGWVNTRKFMSIFTNRERGAKALLVY